MLINIDKLDREIKEAGVPLDGLSVDVSNNIRFDFKPNATQAQRDQAQTILANHDPRDYALEKKQAAIGELRSLTLLAKKSDAEISAYIDSLNIVDPEAKKIIKELSRAVGALERDRGVV